VVIDGPGGRTAGGKVWLCDVTARRRSTTDPAGRTLVVDMTALALW
jgi:hypothetical protein